MAEKAPPESHGWGFFNNITVFLAADWQIHCILIDGLYLIIKAELWIRAIFINRVFLKDSVSRIRA